MKYLILLIISMNSFAADFFVNNFKGNFEQIFTSLTGKEKRSKGIIEYQYPGKIRFSVLEPSESKTTFVSDGRKSWYYTPPFADGEKGEVILRETSQLPLLTVLDVFKFGLKSNPNYDVLKDKEFVDFVFKGKLKDNTKVEKCRLFFKDKKELLSKLEKLVITYADKREATLVFEKLTAPVVFDSNFFTFKIPPNTEISSN